MEKILNIDKAIRASERIRKQSKTIVLAGGCFDIIHLGHIEFLKNAKKLGDFLFLFLESDESIKQKKGENRPINNQINRAKVLEAISFVDYIILLPLLKTDKDYDNLICEIKPAIIATTKNDPGKNNKERQAKLVNAEVLEVIDKISGKSTSDLAGIILKEFYL